MQQSWRRLWRVPARARELHPCRHHHREYLLVHRPSMHPRALLEVTGHRADQKKVGGGLAVDGGPAVVGAAGASRRWIRSNSNKSLRMEYAHATTEISTR